MKRKVNTKAVLVKRKKLCNSSTYSGEKKLEDFWSNNKKDREQFSDKDNTESTPDVPIVKNPSKQTLPIIPISQTSSVNYKNKILFNENFIEELKIIFDPIFSELRNSLLYHPFSDNFFEIDVYNEYINKNLSNILIKFIQHVHDDFLFIPKSFMEKNMIIEKDKLKLFEGINDSNTTINLQYYPINSKEVVYDMITYSVKNYLKNFKKKNKNKKALIILDCEDHLNKIKVIEAICDDMDYNIIRIDQTEKSRNSKLNSISEAFQSNRISSLDEKKSDKLKILEKIINNNPGKLSSLLNNNDGETSSSSIPEKSPNCSKLTDYFLNDEKEKSLLSFVQNNVFSLCSKKKTITLIVDKFSNDEDRLYLNNIIMKISNTKSPIVVLTDNLEFLKNENKNLDNFEICKIDAFNKIYQQKIIYIVNIILFLHLYVKDDILRIMKNETDLNSILIILKGLKINNEKEKCNRIASLAIEISYHFGFQLESIVHFLYNVLRFKIKIFNDKVETIEYIIKNNHTYIKLHEENNNLHNICKIAENYSFWDNIDSKINNFSRKVFNNAYYENKRIIKNSNKKEQRYTTEVNSTENLIYDYIFKEKEFFQKEAKMKQAIKISNIINIIKKEDKMFYDSFWINKNCSISKSFLYETNYLLTKINSLEYDNLLSILAVRKQRNASRLQKNKLTNEASESDKLTGFKKLLSINNINLLERFLNVHNVTENFISFKNNLYENYINYRYFSTDRVYEDMKLIINNNEDTSDLSDYS